MILGIHHIALAARCGPDMVDFYCDALAFELVREAQWSADSKRHELVTGLKGSAAKVWMLKGPNLFLEIFEYSIPQGKPVERRLCDFGYSHIALAIQDIDAEHERLSKKGFQFVNSAPGIIGDPVRALYGRDPEGNVIELLEHSPLHEHPYHYRLIGLE